MSEALGKLVLAVPGVLGLTFLVLGAGLWSGTRWSRRGSLQLYLLAGLWTALDLALYLYAAPEDTGIPFTLWVPFLVIPGYALAARYLTRVSVREYFERARSARPE